MKLPETNTIIFELFYHWLYRQALLDKGEDKSRWPDTEDLIKLYVFADMAQVKALKHQCIDAYKRISEAWGELDGTMIPYVWENTVKSDGLRRFFVDTIIRDYNAEAFVKNPEDFTVKACLEVMTGMANVIKEYKEIIPAKYRRKLDNPLLNACKYHEEESPITKNYKQVGQKEGTPCRRFRHHKPAD
jgi:hypothetical protein